MRGEMSKLEEDNAQLKSENEEQSSQLGSFL